MLRPCGGRIRSAAGSRLVDAGVWLQGINYLAGMLLLVLQKKEEWAFWILVSLLDEGATLPQPTDGVVVSLEHRAFSILFDTGCLEYACTAR